MGIVLFCSCIPTSKLQFNEGKEAFSNVNRHFSEKVTLHKNKTFDYRYSAGLLDSSCSGNWVLKDDSLFLTTHAKFNVGIIRAEELVVGDANSPMVIELLDDTDAPLAGATLQINDHAKTSYLVELDGKVTIYDKKGIENIDIHFLGESYNYVVNDREVNSIKLKVRLKDLSKCHMDRVLYIVRGNKLVTSSGVVLKKY